MTPPLLLADAQHQLLEQATPLGPEVVPVDEALGRFLWSGVPSVRTQPAADLSAMDGYAVHGPSNGPWNIIGESAAGRPFDGKLDFGQAVRMSTGALMPDGALAVLLKEEAVRFDDRLSLAAGGEASARHIRRRGFDFGEGESVLGAGTRMGAAQVALAIAAGATSVEVGRLPRIAVLDSGDELVAGAETWEPHQLPASNGAMIAALAAPFVASVDRLGPVADRMEALAEALAKAEGADIVVTTGGASVGDHDLVRPALEAWGATIDFWRVAIRPGKPLLVARKGETFVLGLPGNPVSSYVTAFLFLLPLLRRLGGASECVPRPLIARTTTELPSGSVRQEFIRARLEGAEVTPIDERDSSALRALAGANVLIDRPINAPSVAVGGEVPVYWLENGGVA